MNTQQPASEYVTLAPNEPMRFAASLPKAARVVGFAVYAKDRKHGINCEIERDGDTPFSSRARLAICNTEAEPLEAMIFARVEYADGSLSMVKLAPVAPMEGGAK